MYIKMYLVSYEGWHFWHRSQQKKARTSGRAGEDSRGYGGDNWLCFSHGDHSPDPHDLLKIPRVWKFQHRQVWYE